jgi:two-component system phosphate regulon sensor histidine kinase PhoR
VNLEIFKTIEQFCENNVHLFRGCEVKIHNPLDRSFLYRINPSLFEMLLINLIANAIKYNRSEQSTLDISFAINKGKLNIRFEDNGIGIEKRELKKIFKKFYRVDRSDNISPRGSGLGLYLVQNIAHIHKGKVIAESKGTGKGSAFTLILPC